ncbi:MAG: methylated-DNA--[protein]-cysteine S-methyltransferase [candidate division WOR-3 bacterium]|nr:methylated-DNA--[protein]-cysteine S-methyltransferase [candidate division WOR-3 bacterium]
MKARYVTDTISVSIEYNDSQLIHAEFSSCGSAIEGVGYGKYILEQLDAYFSGKLKSFDIDFAFKGTEFTRDVLKAIHCIPYGETISYKELAESSGHPRAYRAAGTVCASNDIVLVIPCHRVIRSNGDTGGFGADPSLKKHLIEWEKHNIKSSMP